MVHPDRRLVAVRDAGEAVIEALQIGFRPAKNPSTSNKQPLEDDPRYGPCLEAIRRVMREFGTVEIKEYEEDPSIRMLWVTRHFDDELLCRISILYRADGTASILLDVETANDSITIIDKEDFELSSLQVGMRVAQAQLAVLMAELGSSAEVLDYWMTTELELAYDSHEGSYYYHSNSPDKFVASSWHSLRGVTQRSITNNVNSAKRTMHENSEDTDPWI